MRRVGIGIIGCGAISPAYLRNLCMHLGSIVEVRACADMLREAAEQRAAEFGVPRACTVQELLADPQIELVVNLTNPWTHYDVSMAVLRAGKHLFTEKPLAVERGEGQEIIATAARAGLLVAGAADIFLGAGLQTCRRLLDEGAVGFPSLALAHISMRYRAEKMFRRGVGPMFDMGPYYLGALIATLGPVTRVTGSTTLPFAEKPASDGPAGGGATFKVQTPTNVCGVLNFANGSVAVISAIAESGEGYMPRLEFYGTTGTLQANDPNMYVRPARIRGPNAREITFDAGFAEEGRGLGVAEQAWALRAGRQPRASGALMVHVLDIMHAIHESSDQGRHIALESTCPRPEPFNLSEMMAAFAGAS